mmetsp:Transcript_11027/g.23165  ORF Transcript_11027/g.23165 Transcript_11027/m.23165 type:complete len:201 (+) Transcript_11027:448-1050(+)
MTRHSWTSSMTWISAMRCSSEDFWKCLFATESFHHWTSRCFASISWAMRMRNRVNLSNSVLVVPVLHSMNSFSLLTSGQATRRPIISLYNETSALAVWRRLDASKEAAKSPFFSISDKSSSQVEETSIVPSSALPLLVPGKGWSKSPTLQSFSKDSNLVSSSSSASSSSTTTPFKNLYSIASTTSEAEEESEIRRGAEDS